MAIKQTLRVGNAATMINGMLKLILTKLSVTAFTNWVGLSKNPDDGMNLLQQYANLRKGSKGVAADSLQDHFHSLNLG